MRNHIGILSPIVDSTQAVRDFVIRVGDDGHELSLRNLNKLIAKDFDLEALHDQLVEVPQATKSDALLFLRDHLGASSVTCFGDNTNDLDMFAVAETSCAVSNAHPRALAAADRTIGSNDEDGVARFLAGLVK